MRLKSENVMKPKVPSPHNWKTTDEDEIAMRRLPARAESLRVRNLDARYPIFSNFAVKSGIGLTYSVEIRRVSQRRSSCNCVDFRINGLGTWKHVEAVLVSYLEARHARLFDQAQDNGSPRIDVVPDQGGGALRIENTSVKLPSSLGRLVDSEGRLIRDDVEESLEWLRGSAIPTSEYPRKSTPGDKRAGARRSGRLPCANMNKRLEQANGPPTKRSHRSTRTSVRGCFI